MDVRILTLQDTLRRLIAGCDVSVDVMSTKIDHQFVYHVSKGGVFFGLLAAHPEFVFVVSLDGVGSWRVTVRRHMLPFTKGEELLLGRLAPTLTKAFAMRTEEGHKKASQLGALLALDHLLVAHVLRKDAAGGYWTHLTILQALIDLTFTRYEGSKATSGVVYTSQPKLFIDKLVQSTYHFQPFSAPQQFDRSFFVAPASYRYVDGKNAFYIVDNSRHAIGVVRSRRPQSYNLIERCAALHVEPLVRHMPGRVWCAYIGFNDDVQVRAGLDHAFCWRANHWQVCDDAVISNFASQAGMTARVATPLVRTIRALSELRKGALILIPDDDRSLPRTIGLIDKSTLASVLNEQLEANAFSDAFEANSAIQLLSSDGITIISRTGRLLACGRIIDLSGVSGTGGGGRTQAALAASQYGLAIKISADGPVVAFRHGQRL